jgi:hypothetical protein
MEQTATWEIRSAGAAGDSMHGKHCDGAPTTMIMISFVDDTDPYDDSLWPEVSDGGQTTVLGQRTDR